jgi:competence protein ComEA
MDLDQPSPKSKSLTIGENITRIFNFGLIVLVVCLIGYYIYKNSGSINNSVNSLEAVAGAEIQKTQELGLMVDISGAVKKAGVYQMREGDRIIDVIELAEGYSEDVDLDYIEKNLNQAQKVVDGQKIYIPKINDISSGIVPTNSPSVGSTISKINGKVNINTASKSELMALSGIGTVTADKIIQARPFSNINQIVERGAMKQGNFDKIKDQLTI